MHAVTVERPARAPVELRLDNGKLPRHLVRQARRRGWTIEQLHDLIDGYLEDHWFDPEDLHQAEEEMLL